MNVIFAVTTIVSLVVLTLTAPDGVLPALSSAVEKSLTLSYKLLLVYAVWLGVFELVKNSPIGRLLSKIMQKPIKLVFGKLSTRANELIAINLTANLLGLGGIATPNGIQAETLLEKQNNKYAQTMLFIVAASSLQLLPVSVIGLKTSLGSASPEDVILPTFLATLVSTVCGILSVKVFYKK